jgi:hypothetical protein
MRELITGTIINKMGVELKEPVEYTLILDSGKFDLNPLIGSVLRLTYLGQQTCLHCGSKKVFKQGYCFRCTQALPQCDLCILSPERCHFSQGTCRDESFATSHCFVPHQVYLAWSSHVKVGLTRKGNAKTRWIDQGASSAVLLLEVKNRKAAGEVETHLKTVFSDRTHWQKMLKSTTYMANELEAAKTKALSGLNEYLPSVHIPSVSEVVSIHYPVQNYPEKVKAFNLLKSPVIEDRLEGIKGQYLIFSNGVLNIRKYQGHKIKLRVQ